jgi:hypothetical protein
MGDTNLYFRKRGGQVSRGGMKNNYVSFKTGVWAQPLVGRNAELGRATVFSA